MTVTALPSLRRWTAAGLGLLLLAACSGRPPGAEQDGPESVASSGTSGQLHALFDRHWQSRLEENPLLATSVGDHRFDDRLPSVDAADLERRYERDKAALEELSSFDLSDVSETDRINAAIFERQLWDAVSEYEFGAWQIPMNADSGFHTGFARLDRRMPMRTAQDYRNYLSRLEAFPRYVDQQIANMRIGLERGFSLPVATLDGYEATMRSHIVYDPEESVLWAPMMRMPTAISQEDRAALLGRARSSIMDGVVEGYRRLDEFWTNEYLPATRTTLGASDLPDGRAYYEQRVKFFTTLDISPEEVHEIGLAEVARIRAEMAEIIEDVGFRGSFAEFLEFLRTDPQFYPETGEELLWRAAWIAKTMDGKLPSLFGTLPRLPYTVEPVPDHIAPKYTAGRYVGPPYGSTEPGIYWVNTYNLPSRTLYTLEALSLHEAVPGHHLQNALAQEAEEQPPFRRFDYISAYGEGWGLYSEYLGIEAGFYQDPYSDFGRLTYEMWRACRLVVDTGVHAMGWTREQVMDYMTENTALSLHEIRTETDRYITWPGQALAYKMGELKIKELRQRAESALGPQFDVREFHDAVLENGSVPLPVLEDLIDRYIEEAR